MRNLLIVMISVAVASCGSRAAPRRELIPARGRIIYDTDVRVDVANATLDVQSTLTFLADGKIRCHRASLCWWIGADRRTRGRITSC